MPKHSANASIHLTGLNGIRAIAAISVLISHMNESLSYFGLVNFQGLDLAGFGVTMFFALSGYLITYLLLVEKRDFTRINIRQFYIRRILRIWPLYYFFLLLSVIGLLVLEREALTKSIWYYLVLFANIPFITQTTITILRHYWSLGVEEQFYLFWPWVVQRVSKLARWIIVFIIVMLVLKFLAWIYFKKTGNEIPLSAIHFTRFHCMGIGALGAILTYQGNQRVRKIAFLPIVQIGAWLTILLMAFNQFDIFRLINDEVVAVITVVIIWNVSANPKAIIRLEYPVLDYLGKISYGIYIYHPLFIFLGSHLLAGYFRSLGNPWDHIAIYVFITSMTILTAAVSFRYFEKRFIRLKDRFSRVHSSASANK